MNVHSNIICSNQKVEQPKRPSTDEQINNMSYIHTMEYYSTIKKWGTDNSTWMNLENIVV